MVKGSETLGRAGDPRPFLVQLQISLSAYNSLLFVTEPFGHHYYGPMVFSAWVSLRAWYYEIWMSFLLFLCWQLKFRSKYLDNNLWYSLSPDVPRFSSLAGIYFVHSNTLCTHRDGLHRLGRCALVVSLFLIVCHFHWDRVRKFDFKYPCPRNRHNCSQFPL